MNKLTALLVVLSDLVKVDPKCDVIIDNDGGEGVYKLNVYSSNEKFTPENLSKESLILCMINGWEYSDDWDDGEGFHNWYFD